MNVIDILNNKQIKYKEAGKDYQIQCLNREHEDTHPSMRVDKITGVFHCFSCGFKGNIFREFGADPNYIDIKVAQLQEKIRKLSSDTSLILPSDAVYFNKKYRGIKAETYNKVQAFLSNEEDEFKDRIVFPLYDIRNNLKVFIGRALHSEVEDKYLFFPKHVKPPLFPPQPTVISNSLIIVEGIFDALNLIDKGCINVISAFGTHTLFKTYREKLSHFKILGVNKFYIMFDGDAAGKTAGSKLENILNSNGFNAEIIELPENKDPGNLTEEEVKILVRGLYPNENSSS
jgi:DNA primase